MFNKNKQRTILLFKSLPIYIVIIFILTVIGMNILAKYQLISLPWLALNAGICVSWLAFLILDIVSKHFGAKGGNLLSIIAIIANLVVGSIFFILSLIFKNSDIDIFLFSNWSILLASSIAFIISALTNNYANVFIGKKLSNPQGKKAYAISSFVSTFLGQIVDNFIFVFLAFYLLPNIPGAVQVRWTLLQCIEASILCAGIELLSEVIVSPLGYAILQKWRKDEVGKEYIDLYCKDEKTYESR